MEERVPGDTIEVTIAMAHNVVTELAAKAMTVPLQKHETLLHAQSCRTLARWFRLTEINIEAACGSREEVVDGRPNGE